MQSHCVPITLSLRVSLRLTLHVFFTLVYAVCVFRAFCAFIVYTGMTRTKFVLSLALNNVQTQGPLFICFYTCVRDILLCFSLDMFRVSLHAPVEVTGDDVTAFSLRLKRRVISFPKFHNVTTLSNVDVEFLPRNGLGIACRPFVCPSVRPSVTLVDCDHIGWKSWKLITRTTSLTPSLFVAKMRST